MNDNDLLYSKSETISVVEMRKLQELSNILNKMLTLKEYVKLVVVYNEVVDRLSKESGENEH